MIDADWPEDPFAGQPDALGHDGLTGEVYGPGWHDGQPADPLPAGHDHSDPSVDPLTDPGSPTDTSTGQLGQFDHVDQFVDHLGHGLTARLGGVDATDADADAGHGPVGPVHHGDDLGRHDPTGGPPPGPLGTAGVADPDGVATGAEVSPFPAVLELDVLPSDGRDWVDVDLLGDPAPGSGVVLRFDPPARLLADLHRIDGGDGTPTWSAVADSDDPAVRALALRWRAD
jgi:hypothetical protein